MAFSFMPTPQQQQQAASPFQSQAFQSPFQQTTPQQQQTTQQQFQPQFQQQQQQQQQPQMFLFMNDKSPATYSTKWADLHPDSQKILHQIEDRIVEYRDESQRLDQSSRLYDSPVSNYGFDQDASHIVQELGGISSSMERQKALLQELMGAAKDMLRNTEVAVRSFMMLRPRLESGQGSFYNGDAKKPSVFLVQTVGRFEKYLGQSRKWIEELEQMLLFGNDFDKSSSLLNSLPKVISNVHAFFIHVASKVESIHQYIESMRSAYLADQRRRGESNDPFLEADRRETARQEAAAKRAHPTLNLPAPNSQPSSSSTSVQPALTGSASPATLITPQASSSSAFGTSLFSTPAAATPAVSMSSPSLFGTPNTFGAMSSLFGGASVTTPQQSGFGSTPAASLFGTPSTPAFGSTTPAPAASLFSTPFASGAALGSGASFGATSKTSKPKSRTSRR